MKSRGRPEWELTEKNIGSSGRGVKSPLAVGYGRENVNLQVKIAGFYAFLLRKTTLVARNREQGKGLIDPWGWRCKTQAGVKNLAGGSTPSPSVNSHPEADPERHGQTDYITQWMQQRKRMIKSRDWLRTGTLWKRRHDTPTFWHKKMKIAQELNEWINAWVNE